MTDVSESESESDDSLDSDDEVSLSIFLGVFLVRRISSGSGDELLLDPEVDLETVLDALSSSSGVVWFNSDLFGVVAPVFPDLSPSLDEDKVSARRRASSSVDRSFLSKSGIALAASRNSPNSLPLSVLGLDQSSARSPILTTLVSLSMKLDAESSTGFSEVSISVTVVRDSSRLTMSTWAPDSELPDDTVMLFL